MFKRLVVTLCFFALFAAPAYAQDACDPLNISIHLTTALTEAQKNMSDGDDLGDVFDQLEASIENLRVICAPGSGEASAETEPAAPVETVSSELSFEGDAATVIGPVDIPAGTYRATIKTAGYSIIQISAISGECGAGTSFLSPSLFILMEGQAATGAEAIVTSNKCSALIELSNITAPWTLEFEKLG